jgi:hypothetical protein
MSIVSIAVESTRVVEGDAYSCVDRAGQSRKALCAREIANTDADTS